MSNARMPKKLAAIGRPLDAEVLDDVAGGFGFLLPFIPLATGAIGAAGMTAAVNPAATVQTLTNMGQHLHDAREWLSNQTGTQDPTAINPMGDYTGVGTSQPEAVNSAPAAHEQEPAPAASAEPSHDVGDFEPGGDAPTQMAMGDDVGSNEPAGEGAGDGEVG